MNVDVWWIALDRVDEDLALLCAAERTRADGLRGAALRARFIRARCAMRRILAGYLARPPQTLRFAFGEYGKPSLVDDAGGAAHVRFNLAHADDVAVLAVAHRADVGVDVERIDPALDVDALARHIGSNEECEELAALPPSRRHEAFFDWWTRKEAALKAIGVGLSREPSEVAISPSAQRAGTIVVAPSGERYTVETLAAPPGYAAALATLGSERPHIDLRR